MMIFSRLDGFGWRTSASYGVMDMAAGRAASEAAYSIWRRMYPYDVPSQRGGNSASALGGVQWGLMG